VCDRFRRFAIARLPRARTRRKRRSRGILRELVAHAGPYLIV
jgi:hypothetical protein